MKALFIISFFCLAVTFNISGQATPQEILNKAIYQEEVNGNLEEAINLFLEIVENNSTNRTVTAEAFYHLGLTNEKLGNKKAKEYYEKVVNNFGDKLETVLMAKERLQNLNIQTRNLNVADAKISNQVIAQTIYTPGGFLGAISPDEKYLSYVDWKHGDMAIYSLETGENRSITNEGTWTPPIKFGDASVWSPDGKFLAYYWVNGKNTQLRVQNLETGVDEIFAQTTGEGCPWPIEWTNDGKHILATGGDKDNSNLQLISVKDGSVKIIYNLGAQCPCGGASISPDGKYVVASLGKDLNPRDIHIFSVDGTLDNELISFPGADWAPEWTPDGQKVIFVSNRSGSPALWSVKVKDGQKVGKPKLIYEGISDNYSPMRFTSEGRFIFSSTPMYYNVFQATVRTDEGVIETPEPITGDPPGIIYDTPFWSPDGSKIGYIVRGFDGYHYGSDVIIRDLKTGKEKELKLGLRALEQPQWRACPQWSTDGKNLLLQYHPISTDNELVLVNLETAEKKYLKGDNWKVYGPKNTILYIGPLGSKIIQQNISTSKEKILYESSKPINHLTISKDKTTLAFFVEEIGVDGTQQELYSMPINSSEPKMLWKVTEEQFFSWSGGLNFFPDGKTLLLSLSTNDMEKSREKSRQLYTINISTLEKKPLGKKLTDSNDFFGHVRLSPDGKKIAFSKGKTSCNIWSLEFDF